MFSTFPREIGTPKRKVIWSKDNFLKLIDESNCKNNVFTSVYGFKSIKTEKYRDEPNYNTAEIDKILFELDNEEGYVDMLKLHNEFLINNYKHSIMFSGKGFHVYLFVKYDKSELINPKDTIARVQKYFIDKLKLENTDPVTIGNIAQMIRVPNTYNIKRRRYCIPLSKKDLELKYEEIKEKALQQNLILNYIIGIKSFNITEYDKEIEYKPLEIDIPELDSNTKIDLKKLNTPDCVKMMLNQPHPIWIQRGFVLIFLRDRGLSSNEILKLVKNYWEPEVIRHALTDLNGDRQLYYICRDVNRYLFPSCNKLTNLELCPRRCQSYPQALYIC